MIKKCSKTNSFLQFYIRGQHFFASNIGKFIGNPKFDYLGWSMNVAWLMPKIIRPQSCVEK